MRKLLSVLTIIVLLLPTNAVALAALQMQTGTSVPVTVTITHVHEIHCDEGLLTPCPNDYYTNVDIDGQGFQRRDWCDNCDKDFRPNWAFTRMVDRSRNPVKLLVELRDRDDSPETDDTIDITAGDNKDLDLTFDLNTCSFQGTGLTAQQGAGIPGNLQGQSAGGGTESAEITFTITTPFCLTNSYNIDSDGDGLFDGWEIAGLDIKDPNVPNDKLVVLPVLDGQPDLDLGKPPYNANPLHKDLFVEVDWMACSAGGCVSGDTHTHEPPQVVLDTVYNAFNIAPVENPDGTRGITLHALKDEGVPDVKNILFKTRNSGPQDDFDDIKLGPGGPGTPISSPCVAGGYFGTAADRASLTNCSKILAAKTMVFRYMIFGDSYSELPGSSGNAEGGVQDDGTRVSGNDFIVTVDPAFDTDVIKNVGGKHVVEEGTFMHELGHTLGLDHGGGDRINCKPNYLSVMNYTLQIPIQNKNIPPGIPQRLLDYSNKALDSLNEALDPLNENSGLDEGKGIGGPAIWPTVYGVDGKLRPAVRADAAIDWNGKNGVETKRVAADINFIDSIKGCDKPSPNETLSGFDDWNKLIYKISDSPYFNDGVSRPVIPELTEDMVQAMSAQADLKLAKSVDKATAIGGDTLNYSVMVTNAGRGKAINVSLTDTLPDGSTQTLALPNLDKDASNTQTFTFPVACTAADGTVITNKASVTGTDESGIPDPALSDNAAQASTTVQTPVLTLSKTATASVNAGEAITYTITYENTGSGAAANVVITDIVPAGVYYSKALDLGAGPKPDTVILNADGSRTLTWNVGAVSATSGSKTIVFTARPTLLALEGTSYGNNVSLSFQNGNSCVYDTLTAVAPTSVTVMPPTRDPLTLGFWRNHPEQWTAEILARIQATDQRYDTNGDGALSVAEATTMFASGGNQPKVLQMQLLATYFDLATRRINAGTTISSVTTASLGLANVRDAALLAIDTLLLPVNQKTKTKYDNATVVLDEINNNKSEVY